jgi:hypothetical protein
MVSAEIEWEGRDPQDAADALRRLQAILPRKLEDAALDIGLRIGGDAAEEAPSDTGDLRADLVEPIVENVSQTIIKVRVGSNLPQAAPHEFGTKPFFPPPSELRGWARRVLGDEDAAFLVARSISETGIEEKRYLRDAVEQNLEWIANRIDEAVREAFQEVGFDV